MRESWLQGNWNAWVIFDCDPNESRRRCKRVPAPFRSQAIGHAKTYWAIQGHKPKSVKQKPKSVSRWPKLEITPEDWEQGRYHAANANHQYLDKVYAATDQNQLTGWAAEYTVVRWFKEQGIEPHHNPNPTNTNPDFQINGMLVDLKTCGTKGGPRPGYDADIAYEDWEKGEGKIDWYMFGKFDATTEGDFYIVGFETWRGIREKGVFYRKGERTRTHMDARKDCWCVRYDELVNPLEWLNEKPG